MPLNASALSILHAVFGMGSLTLVMMLWMSVVRLPAMKREGMTLQDAAHTDVLKTRLPTAVTRVADNFRHLTETPTVFYAMALGVVAAGLADSIHAACAWAFLACRVLHSIVQATINIVSIRAMLYTLSWLALATMIVRATIASMA
jgi:hypothetical protein